MAGAGGWGGQIGMSALGALAGFGAFMGPVSVIWQRLVRHGFADSVTPSCAIARSLDPRHRNNRYPPFGGYLFRDARHSIHRQ